MGNWVILEVAKLITAANSVLETFYKSKEVSDLLKTYGFKISKEFTHKLIGYKKKGLKKPYTKPYTILFHKLNGTMALDHGIVGHANSGIYSNFSITNIEDLSTLLRITISLTKVPCVTA